MREILFRAKPVDDFDADVDAVTIGRPYDGFIYGWGVCVVGNGTGNMMRNDNDLIQIDPATVGQFTGLTDKNGQRIFEGDIVRCVDNYFVDKRIFVGTVDFADASFRIIKDEVFTFYRWQDYDVEVLGNIHDNLELLGGTE